MKNIQNLSQEECGIHYKEILAGANDHWENGEIMASHMKYHTGVANLILSTEELVKAIVLYLDSKGFKFRSISGIDAFFRNHELRYIISFFVLIIGNLGKDLMKFLDRLRKGEITAEYLENYVNEHKDKDSIPPGIKFYFYRKLIVFNQELEWFSNVKTIREDSMYSKYQGEFRSPLMFTKEEYDTAKERLEIVRWIGRNICDDSNDEVAKDSWELALTKLHELNIYDSAGKLLKQVKESRMGPFNYLKAGVKSL